MVKLGCFVTRLSIHKYTETAVMQDGRTEEVCVLYRCGKMTVLTGLITKKKMTVLTGLITKKKGMFLNSFDKSLY